MEIQLRNKIRRFRTWLKCVMKKIIENYGTERELINPTVYGDIILQYLDASKIYLELTLAATNTCEARRECVIVKRPVQNIKYRATNRLLLYNEITFYQTYAHRYDNIPKCYYANWGSYPEVIVLQRIEEYKYHSFLQKHPRAVYVAPLDHLYSITLAVREIARFHSKGYIIKELQTDIFHTIVTRFRKNWVEKISDFHVFFKLLALKMAKHLLSNIDISICKKVENIFSMAPQVFRNMSCPQESLSTICHGNLKRSNVFFNTSNIDKPVMLVNFEFAIYAPAIIDLAMYMYLCYTYFEIPYFHKIIEGYCFELRSCLRHAGIQDLEKHSFNVFWAEYQKYAIGGLIIVCFNLPAVIGQVEEEALNEMVQKDYVNCIQKDEKNEMCKALSLIIMHLETVGCLSNYQEII